MLKELKKVELYNDGVGYVALIDSSEANLDLEHRKQFIADCASVTRGRQESTNVDKMYNMLLTENCGSMGRPFEFCPVYISNETEGKTAKTIDSDPLGFINTTLSHSYVAAGNEFFTTTRLEDSVYNKPEEVKDFKVIVGRVPRFVYTHLATHTQLSTMCQTARLGLKVEPKFYIPEDCTTTQKDHLETFTALAQATIVSLKASGVPNEIAQRFLPQTEYVYFVMAGWKNNPEAWDHFLHLRTGSWTQKETKEVANGIKELLND